MKYMQVYALFLMVVFHTASGRQNQTNVLQDNFSKEHNGYSESQLKELTSSKVPMSQVRNVTQDRNGNIMIAEPLLRCRRGGLMHKKGNIWTTGSIDPRGGSVWALSRYDYKPLYNKKPTVTEIMSGPPAFLGLLEANDGSIWFGSGAGVHCYDGKMFTDFKSAAGQK